MIKSIIFGLEYRICLNTNPLFPFTRHACHWVCQGSIQWGEEASGVGRGAFPQKLQIPPPPPPPPKKKKLLLHCNYTFIPKSTYQFYITLPFLQCLLYIMKNIFEQEMGSQCTICRNLHIHPLPANPCGPCLMFKAPPPPPPPPPITKFSRWNPVCISKTYR